ncbi:MAG: hypothetical protein JW804_01445 [Sedimentisphaerales bacterium]|nr:hypothetical protein [Sedimentisphaerales bacterium]
MDIPKLEKAVRYVGLYVVDFGEHSGVGFTAQEVAELLESEKYKDVQVYKIHKAYPDGRIELKGIPAQTFQLETGMFFYSADEETAKDDFKRLSAIAVSSAPPCRAKVHLAKYSDDKFVTAIVYPAEFDEEISDWLLANDYKTPGLAEGGISATQQYYQSAPEVLERHQLFGKDENNSRTGDELLAKVRLAVQR